MVIHWAVAPVGTGSFMGHWASNGSGIPLEVIYQKAIVLQREPDEQWLPRKDVVDAAVPVAFFTHTEI